MFTPKSKVCSTHENEAAPQDHEQPAEKHRGLIAAIPEYMWSQDQDQTHDQVNDGNAGKEGYYAPQDVMEDGQEPQVFVV